MAERYPAFSEQGDRVEIALQERLEATGALNQDEIDNVVQVVAASYQKVLQLRYIVESLLAAVPGGQEGTPAEQDRDDRAALADGLEDAENLLDALTTLHATTRDKLFYAAQRVRSGRR